MLRFVLNIPSTIKDQIGIPLAKFIVRNLSKHKIYLLMNNLLLCLDSNLLNLIERSLLNEFRFTNKFCYASLTALLSLRYIIVVSS